jgi:archaellum component FlaG (FlaF/FlaG flagellin family)
MRITLNIDKKILVGALILFVIFLFIGAHMAGFIGQPVYASEREASEAITNISTNIEQIESIIEDIDQKLG